MDRYVRETLLDMQSARSELVRELEAFADADWSRYVPYGERTLHDLLAHLAAADQSWALAAQGLLKGEAEERDPLTPDEVRDARRQAIAKRRDRTPLELLAEMDSRRRLLISLFELLEPRHLALPLRSFETPHNSVRERIWLGYHDRLHAADVRRTLRMNWHPQRLAFLPDLQAVADSFSPDATLYVIYSVDPVYWERPSAVPGWTFRQLLAHIATGDWVLQLHLRHCVEHGSVATWPDIAAGNAERLEARKFTTHATLVEEYLSMRHETLRLLSQLRPQHLSLEIDLWFLPPPNRRTMLEYLRGFDLHDQQHREQLRPAMRYAR